MTLNNQYLAPKGIELVQALNSTSIKVLNQGIYNIQFSAQAIHSGGGQTNIDIWFRKNGQDLSNSMTRLTMSNAAYHVLAWNIILDCDADDEIQIVWSAVQSDLTLVYEPATLVPIRPSIPSLIVTINQVSN